MAFQLTGREEARQDVRLPLFPKLFQGHHQVEVMHADPAVASHIKSAELIDERLELLDLNHVQFDRHADGKLQLAQAHHIALDVWT